MVDVARTRFPDDMVQSLTLPDNSTLGSYAEEAMERVKHYARDEPVSFALWAFGLGFILGWKLKPW